MMAHSQGAIDSTTGPATSTAPNTPSSARVEFLTHSIPALPATEERERRQVQYASYSAEEEGKVNVSEVGWDASNGQKNESQLAAIHAWTPVPLRRWFWVPLVVLMGCGAIALEVALRYSKVNQGWATKGKFTTEQGVMHYVYTLPPVAISMFFAALWAWTDLEIRKLQPYVDLAHGDSPPQRSLLLDYTRSNTFFVWTIAARNQHWLVTTGSLLVLLTFSFQPLSAALFNVQDIWFPEPEMVVNNLAALGLNQNTNFQDLTSFLTAAGYASADVLYGIGDPRFVHQGYTIGEFQFPNIANGTVFANTSAVLSQTQCNGPDAGSLSMVKLADGTGWNNSAAFDGCTFSWNVNKSATNLFGVGPVPDSPACANLTAIPEQFRPILFWFFTYQPQPMASISMCSPTLSFFDVTATVDLASGNLTDITQLGPIGSSSDSGLSQPGQFAGNLSGAPLNGRAYNGLFFALDNPDPFTVGRMSAIQLALPAAVFQAAESSPEGLTAAFQNGAFANLSSSVYGTYLSLVAKTVYFLDHQEPLRINVNTIHKRLFFSDVATHLLAVVMLVLCIAGTALQLWHRKERRILHLAHKPGTIASAVSIGAQTGVGSVLAGRQRTEDMLRVLEDKRFRIDPRTMKIVMKGEEGYDFAETPDASKIVFSGEESALSRLGRRLSVRFGKNDEV